jgi:hypothetical protein
MRAAFFMIDSPIRILTVSPSSLLVKVPKPQVTGANGGFNPLYQIDGPRSIELALKLQF